MVIDGETVFAELVDGAKLPPPPSDSFEMAVPVQNITQLGINTPNINALGCPVEGP
jgi:hypothetical protein